MWICPYTTVHVSTVTSWKRHRFKLQVQVPTDTHEQLPNGLPHGNEQNLLYRPKIVSPKDILHSEHILYPKDLVGLHSSLPLRMVLSVCLGHIDFFCWVLQRKPHFVHRVFHLIGKSWRFHDRKKIRGYLLNFCKGPDGTCFRFHGSYSPGYNCPILPLWNESRYRQYGKRVAVLQ